MRSPLIMDKDGNYPSRRFGLRTRLLALVALALLPIFALAALQAMTDIRESSAARRQDLIEITRLFAHDQTTLIQGIRDLMETIALIPEVHESNAECQELLATIGEIDRAHTNFAIVGLDGRIRCSGLSVDEGIDFTEADWFGDIMSGEPFSIGRSRFGAVSREPVLVIAIPLHRDGELAGVMLTSVRISFLEALGLEAQSSSRRIAGLVDRSGRVITQRDNLSVAQISEERMAQAVQTDVLVFDREQSDGSRQTMALAAIFGDDLFVLLAQPSIPLLAWENINVSATIILPILMWALALVVVWIASDYLILRWLEYLARFARLYGRGRYELKPERTRAAPQEIRELAESLVWMAERISERDEELQESLEQKQTLIREVHHRVKNNLQIITSLINLQLGRSNDDGSGTALRQAQTRINALAMIHRNLYEAENLTQIQIAPFIEDLARLTHEASTGDEFDVELRFDCDLGGEILTTDQAVPLSMFMTEAMTNAYKHAFRHHTSGQVLSLKIGAFHDSTGTKIISVTIKDNGPGLDPGNTHKGVGSTLIDAFAIQLNGEASLDSKPGEGVTVSVRFPVE